MHPPPFFVTWVIRSCLLSRGRMRWAAWCTRPTHGWGTRSTAASALSPTSSSRFPSSRCSSPLPRPRSSASMQLLHHHHNRHRNNVSSRSWKARLMLVACSCKIPWWTAVVPLIISSRCWAAAWVPRGALQLLQWCCRRRASRKSPSGRELYMYLNLSIRTSLFLPTSVIFRKDGELIHTGDNWVLTWAS